MSTNGSFFARQCHRMASVAASLLLLAGSHPAAAADESGAAQFVIHQPAQKMADALRSIARQTGASLLFDPTVVGQRMSPPISGRMSTARALALAVEGSGLVVEAVQGGSWVVRARRASDMAPPGSGSPPAQPPDVEPAPSTEMARVEVTGSRLKRIEAEGPLPVNVYRREDIEKSGQPTLAQFISTLNEASVYTGDGSYGGTANQGTVQLRGLPLGSTLVLVNGRRLQAVGSSSGNFFNLNLIPIAAVDRVEVVPVGSSAVYGGDALAGVVNIILKRSMDGLHLDARLAGGDGFEDGSLALATGARGARGSYLVVGSLGRSTPLTMAERDLFRDADYRRFGGSDVRSTLCTPGTVTSNTADNLPGMDVRTAGLPQLDGSTALTIERLAPTAGRPNLCSELGTYSYTLTSAKQTAALHAAGDLELKEGWTAFGELTYTDDRSSTPQQGFALNNVLVPATNAFNPFGVPVRVSTVLSPDNGRRGQQLFTRYARVLGGIRAELGAGWDLEVSLSTSRDKGHNFTGGPTVDAAARTAALASADPATALNPFTAGRAASDAVLQSIWKDSIRTNLGQRDQVSAFARGSVAKLPAGSADAIIGMEASRDRYHTVFTGGFSDNRRRFQAVYGELRAPLLRGDSASGRAGDMAAVTVAGRRDRYSDFGSASTYQAGLELRPVRSLLLRGSAATSFKPPTLLQTKIDSVVYTTEFFSLVDPQRNRAPIVGGELLRTHNPELMPERGKAFALGASFEPEGGMRMAATAWRIKVDGLIGLLAPQTVLDNEALFPRQVVRAPSTGGVPGVVTQVYYQETNFGSVQADGVDLEAALGWSSPWGRWNLGVSATRTSRYDVVIAPQTPVVHRLGRRFSDYWAPRWKGRLGLGLDGRGWSVGASVRYLGSYLDAGTSDRKLGNHVTVDLSGRLDLAKMGMPVGGMRSAVLSAGIINAGNRLPEYVSTVPYYDITQSDWRGRTFTVRLSMDW